MKHNNYTNSRHDLYIRAMSFENALECCDININVNNFIIDGFVKKNFNKKLINR